MSGWPPSGSRSRDRKKREDLLERISEHVEESLESPFTALESAFDSLGDLFDGGDSELTSDGLQSDMKKLKHDLKQMKASIRNKTAKAQRVSKGGTSVSFGNTGKKHKHYMKLKDEEGNLIEVTYNNPSDISIRTEGNIDSDLMDEVKRHIRAQLASTPVNVLNTEETYSVQEPKQEDPYQHQPLLWSRTWRGEKKDPLDFTSESKVTVAGHSMLGRKYEVAVDGTTVYILKIEEMMERRHDVGDALDIFVKTWTDDEKAIMLKVFDGLEALGIIEGHHEAARKLISS